MRPNEENNGEVVINTQVRNNGQAINNGLVVNRNNRRSQRGYNIRINPGIALQMSIIRKHWEGKGLHLNPHENARLALNLKVILRKL